MNNFKLSKFNHFFTNDNKKYVYNILSTSIMEIDDDVYNSLFNNKLGNLSNEYIKELTEEGFIVGESTDEVANYQYFYDNDRYVYNADILTVTFIPTYNCNLKCPYCYEGLNKVNKKIDIQGIDSILKFINNNIAESKEGLSIKKLIVSLYGGEPLLCKKELIYFCNNVYKISNQYNLPIIFDMTSNFTLLDDEIIDLIKKYKIIVQVSIDGVKASHDTRRIYKNGNGTYDVILNNLKKMYEQGLKNQLTIRVNLDKETMSQADEIYDLFSMYSNDVYFGILAHYSGFNDGYENKCMDSECSNHLFVDKINDIYQTKKNYLAQNFGKQGACTLNSKNKFFIDCNLDVYKCDLLINHKECKVGTIDQDGNLLLNDNYFKQMCHTAFKNEKCRNCKFLPLCGGGCAAQAYINKNMNDGNIDLYHCEYNDDKLNMLLIDYVKRVDSNE